MPNLPKIAPLFKYRSIDELTKITKIEVNKPIVINNFKNLINLLFLRKNPISFNSHFVTD